MSYNDSVKSSRLPTEGVNLQRNVAGGTSNDNGSSMYKIQYFAMISVFISLIWLVRWPRAPAAGGRLSTWRIQYHSLALFSELSSFCFH